MLNKNLWLVFLLVVLSCSSLLHAETAVSQPVTGIRAKDGDTILVEFSDGTRDTVRYASINSPGFENSDCLAEEAQQRNEELTKRVDLWLELDPTNDGYRRAQGRLLGHVFLSPDRTQTSSVAVQLVADGYARLDVRNPNDTAIRDGQDFDVRYTDWIIPAQIEAATNREGWWGECDDHMDSDVIIAAIKQWSDDEVVYIVNRGDDPIDLAAGWKLCDKAGNEGSERNRLDLSDNLIDECLLPPGGLLRVHSSSIATGKGGVHTTCGELEIDFYWTGYTIWDQDSDEAWLHDPEGNLVYYYYYHLNWD